MLVYVPGTRVESAHCRDHDHALIVVCNGAAMQASTGGARLRLVHGERWIAHALPPGCPAPPACQSGPLIPFLAAAHVRRCRVAGLAAAAPA